MRQLCSPLSRTLTAQSEIAGPLNSGAPERTQGADGGYSLLHSEPLGCVVRKNMPGLRIYVDQGLTGANRARPGLREAMAACREGDTLVVT